MKMTVCISYFYIILWSELLENNLQEGGFLFLGVSKHSISHGREDGVEQDRL